MFAVIIHCNYACLQVKIDTVEKFKASMGAFHTRAAAEANKLKARPSSNPFITKFSIYLIRSLP